MDIFYIEYVSYDRDYEEWFVHTDEMFASPEAAERWIAEYEAEGVRLKQADYDEYVRQQTETHSLTTMAVAQRRHEYDTLVEMGITPSFPRTADPELTIKSMDEWALYRRSHRDTYRVCETPSTLIS